MTNNIFLSYACKKASFFIVLAICIDFGIYRPEIIANERDGFMKNVINYQKSLMQGSGLSEKVVQQYLNLDYEKAIKKQVPENEIDYFLRYYSSETKPAIDPNRSEALLFAFHIPKNIAPVWFRREYAEVSQNWLRENIVQDPSWFRSSRGDYPRVIKRLWRITEVVNVNYGADYSWVDVEGKKILALLVVVSPSINSGMAKVLYGGKIPGISQTNDAIGKSQLATQFGAYDEAPARYNKLVRYRPELFEEESYNLLSEAFKESKGNPVALAKVNSLVLSILRRMDGLDDAKKGELEALVVSKEKLSTQSAEDAVNGMKALKLALKFGDDTESILRTLDGYGLTKPAVLYGKRDELRKMIGSANGIAQ